MTDTGIKFHPLADIFPLMEGAEFEELVADIKANGQIEPITFYEDMILDGRNRYRACIAADVDPAYHPFIGDDPAAYVVSANIRRRHLTAEQKRDLIAKLLKTSPEKSDRQIADTVKASPTTVGTVRSEMEATGDVSKLDTRTDTKGRKQPARKGWSRERRQRHRAKKAGRPKDQPADYAKTTVDLLKAVRAVAERDERLGLTDDEGDSPEVIWRRGLIYRATESAVRATYEDWSEFKVDDEVRVAVRRAVEAWQKLDDYLATLATQLGPEIISDNALAPTDHDAQPSTLMATDDPGPIPEFLLRTRAAS